MEKSVFIKREINKIKLKTKETVMLSTQVTIRYYKKIFEQNSVLSGYKGYE